MKKVFINVTNHDLTEDQIADIKSRGDWEIVDLPDDLRAIWSRIPATMSVGALRWYLYPLDSWLYSIILNSDVVVILVHGETTAVYRLVSDIERTKLLHCDILAVAATTERQSIEVAKEDGYVEKRSVFVHRGFRSYYEREIRGWDYVICDGCGMDAPATHNGQKCPDCGGTYQ